VLLIFNFYFQSQSNVFPLKRGKMGKITRYGEMYGIRVRPSNVHPMEQAVWKSLSKMKKKKINKYGAKYDVCTITSKTPPVINLDFVEAPTNIDLIAGRAAQEDSEEAAATEGNWKSYFYNLRYSKSLYKK
jgi:hypothetical protein